VRLTHSRTPLLGAAAAAVLLLTGCNSAVDDASGGGGGDAATGKVAFLMPDQASTRYELFDAPLFTAKMKELCAGCEVLYSNANADAAKQQQQAETALTQGVKVLVIDPVDSASAASIVQQAQARGVKVVTYDRPVPNRKADYYISFDNEKIGAQIAQSLVDKLKKDGAQGGVLQVNGSPTDAAAGLIKKGVHSVLDPSGIPILAEFDTPEWDPTKAQNWVSGQITKFGPRIAGVAAANDGTGGGAIAAFKAAAVNPVPPVTGNDATLQAAQSIVTGDQYMTISKPIKTVADAAAETAYAFVKGETPAPKTTLFDTPSELFTPTVVTKANVFDQIIKNGPLKAADVCKGEFARACAGAGIQ
jgi:D-xylose transport system substrate-binding protein